MKKTALLALFVLLYLPTFCWGFFAHRKINYYAVFLLPPDMMVLYKPAVNFLSEHAVDPDKRRYSLPEEGARHFIDLDHYGKAPYPALPRRWDSALVKFPADTLRTYGIVPWHTLAVLQQLTNAFKEKNASKILLLSAAIGHYIADAHVPLHASSNHNGQFTGQQGIHAFWESRLPELLADKEWDFFIGRAEYIRNPGAFLWSRVVESAAAADTVLRLEKQLSRQYGADRRFGFEERNGILVRQYTADYSMAYNRLLKGMVERRMRQSIFATASFWYTAWVNAGQPSLENLSPRPFGADQLEALQQLDAQWKAAGKGKADCY